MAEQNGTGAAIRRARADAGLSLRQLAAEIGVSAGTMSAIENGKVALTVERLQQIADRLGTPRARLLEPQQVPEPAPRRDATGPGPRGGDWRRFAALDLDPGLRAAVEVFTEIGYHGATMRQVAAAADSSVAGIYHYHRGKQQLLATLMTRTADDMEWRVTSADEEGGRPAERFARMVEALALAQAVRHELAFISATELRSLEEPERSRVVAATERIRQRLEAAAVQAAADGDFGVADPRGTARVVISLCLALPHRPDREELADPQRVAAEYAEHALSMMRG
ncbi:TetR family transcriptional regulator [Gordonia sp. VNK21]|uniref:TetR family transcriptional regulator n=1 Tax=Gordonia sp. VNK21 TaxID=3382483 RepID=UPI0038D3C265